MKDKLHWGPDDARRTMTLLRDLAFVFFLLLLGAQAAWMLVTGGYR